ncbi:MAG: WbqC family protein [Ignavibacteriae bacterium]|nr:WbqC family protein [Ignavibacteriota bacterium]
MQPYFFPYIGYYQLINAVDKFVLLDDVNFIKKGWINRNYILVNGKPNLFTIPLRKASQNKMINEIEIDNESGWSVKFLKTLTTSYKNAGFFKQTIKITEELLKADYELISDLIYCSIIKIKNYLGIETEIIRSSSVYNSKDLKGQDRILDICLKEKAERYINAINGKSLYSKEVFLGNGVEIKFIKTNKISYSSEQAVCGRSLSFLDMLMHCSVPEINEMLFKYELE